MLTLLNATVIYLRRVAVMRGWDRGEVGPIGYTVMVTGIVVLALAVIAWGNTVADDFMDDISQGGGGGDGGDGGDGGE